jgi:hypothetical protein
MGDVYRAANEGFRIFGGATEFDSGRKKSAPTTAIGDIILLGSKPPNLLALRR